MGSSDYSEENTAAPTSAEPMKRCQVHGLPYYASSPACPLCRFKSWEGSTGHRHDTARRGLFWVGTLGVLLAVGIWRDDLRASWSQATGADPLADAEAESSSQRALLGGPPSEDPLGLSEGTPSEPSGEAAPTDGAFATAGGRAVLPPDLRVCSPDPQKVDPGEACHGTTRSKNQVEDPARYYLPAGRAERAVPLLLLLHAETDTALGAIDGWHASAARHGYAILAPAAERSTGWRTPENAEGQTRDVVHILAALEEIEHLPELQIDRERLLVAGAGKGAAMAAFLASNYSEFPRFAAISGVASTDALGPLRPAAFVAHHQPELKSALAADHRLLVQRGFTVDPLRQHPTATAVIAATVSWWLTPTAP